MVCKLVDGEAREGERLKKGGVGGGGEKLVEAESRDLWLTVSEAD